MLPKSPEEVLLPLENVAQQVDGEADQVDAALDWLRGEGITVDLLGDVLEG